MVTVDGRLDVQPAAVTRPETTLDACGGFLDRVGGEETAHLVNDAAQVLRVDEVGQFRPHELLRGAAVDTGGGRGDVPEDAAGRGDHDDVAGALHQGAEVVLLLRQFLGEGDVVEQHDALPHDEREHHRAAGDQHHAVDAAAIEDVVENPQRAHGRREIRREGGEGAGDGPGGRVPAELASGQGQVGVRSAALPGHVLADHARGPRRALPVRVVPVDVRRAGRGPRGIRQEQRAGEPAGIEEMAGAVAVVHQRRGEEGVAHQGQRHAADRGVDRCAVHRRAPEVQREHHADQCDVEQRIRQRQRDMRHARPFRLRGLGEREAPGQGEQRASDQPGVEREADPAGLSHGPLGEDQQSHDGGRCEAQEEEVGVRGAGDGLPEDDLVPPPDQVAQGRHRRREAEQQPGGSKAGAAVAGVEDTGHGGGAGGGAQPEVAHDQGHFVRTPAERATDGVCRADQGEDESEDRARPGTGGRRAGQQCPGGRRLCPQLSVQRGRGGRRRAHRTLPGRAAPGSRGPRCPGWACLPRLPGLRW